MGRPPKNYIESCLPMITLYAIFGHEVFRYPASTARVRWSVYYTIVMLVTTAIILYVTFLYALKFNYETIEEKLFVFIFGMNIVIVLCTGSLNWYHYNKRKSIEEGIMAIDETLTELGADCEHDNTYRAGFVYLVFQLIIVFVLNSVDSLWVIDKYNVFEVFWIVGVLHYPHHVSGFVLMKCAMTLRAVGVRFRATNNVLHEILKQNEGKENCGNGTISQQISQRGAIIRVGSQKRSDRHIVQTIKSISDAIEFSTVHLELSTISEGLNTIYGVEIVLQLGACFAFCTVLGYDLYVVHVNSTFSNRTQRICGLLLWFFVYFMKILIINHMGASVTYEAYKTREIIQDLNMMTNDPELKHEVRHFSLQMIQNPLSFTPMGFFTLGYGLVSSVLGTVATYLVILIQTNIIPEFMLVHKK